MPIPSTNILPSQKVSPEMKQIFRDVDRGQAPVGINPEADRAAGEYGRADVVTDRVARET